MLRSKFAKGIIIFDVVLLILSFVSFTFSAYISSATITTTQQTSGDAILATVKNMYSGVVMEDNVIDIAGYESVSNVGYNFYITLENNCTTDVTYLISVTEVDENGVNNAVVGEMISFVTPDGETNSASQYGEENIIYMSDSYDWSYEDKDSNNHVWILSIIIPQAYAEVATSYMVNIITCVENMQNAESSIYQ